MCARVGREGDVEAVNYVYLLSGKRGHVRSWRMFSCSLGLYRKELGAGQCPGQRFLRLEDEAYPTMLSHVALELTP